MFKIEHLYKKYKGEKKYAVEDLSLNLDNGQIFGFLGANGAGKSTTIKCITGILSFKEGNIELNGCNLKKDPQKFKSMIGYVSDDNSIYENLTGFEFVSFVGKLYNVPIKELEERIALYSKRFKMDKVLDCQLKTYSYGLKQKINIIAALVHEPDLWILDEPLLGLDPISIQEIKDCMIEWKEKGKIVFFSSHNIDLVEKICDVVGIIEKGKLDEIIKLNEFDKGESLEKYFLQKLAD